MKKRNSTQLKKDMEGRWLNALRVLAPSLCEALDRLGDSVPCPVNGGTDGFRLFGEGDKHPTSISGGGVSHAYKVFPEGIDLLMWVNNWSFITAFDELSAWLSGSTVNAGPIYLPKQKIKTIDEAGLRKWLNRIWAEGLPLTDLHSYPAKAYFSYRRVNSSAISARDVRFHPCLNYKDKQGKLIGKYGAILLLVRNNQGEPVQIHRTFITKGGLKVNLGKDNKPRKRTPAINRDSRGRHVRLFLPENGYLGTCEGLETALAVHQVKQLPVWPNLSNTLLHSFDPPQGVHTILNFVDKDRKKAGEESAEILKKHLEPKGIRVFNLLPPIPILECDKKGVDWADQLKRDKSGFDLINQVIDFAEQQSA